MRDVGVSSIARAILSQRSDSHPPPTAANANVRIQNQESDGSAKETAQVHVALLLLGEFEQRRRLEVEESRDDQVGERTDADVVQVHGLVVELASVRDAFLEPRDAALQVPEAFVGLQVRVVLGDREQAAESLAKLLLRRADGRDVAACPAPGTRRARACMTRSSVSRS